MSYKPAEMFKVLAENSKHFLLTFDQWKVIYAVFERDKEAFRRYYPMICVSSNGKFSYLVRELVTNDEFWNYCCKNFTVDDE